LDWLKLPLGERVSRSGPGFDLLRWLERSVAADWRVRVGLVVAAFSLAVLLGLGSVGLWGARERRVAACVADIVRNGRWLVPHLWARPRLEKPAVPYWFSAAAAVAAGRLDEWTLRLPCLLLAGLLIAVVYRFGYEAAGPRGAVLASVLLLSSFFYVIELRKQSSDLYLAAFSACCLACWWQGYRSAASRWLCWPAAGLFAGLAMLAKGPVIVLVLGPAMLGMLLSGRRLGVPAGWPARIGIGVPVALVALWAAAVFWQYPQAWLVWLGEVDLKVTGGTYRSDRGPWYYLLQWPGYLFPWSIFSVAAVGYGLKARESAPGVARLCWWWFFGSLMAFSVLPARKVYYLLPAVAGLAVLAAYAVVQIQDRLAAGQLARFRRLGIHVQLLMLWGTWLALGVMGWQLRQELGVGAALSAAVMFAVAAWLHWQFWRTGRLIGATIAGALCFAAALGAAHAWLLPKLDAERSAKPLAAAIAARVPADEPLYFVGEADPSLWFYLERPLKPIDPLLPAERKQVRFIVMRDRKRNYYVVPGRRLSVLARIEHPERTVLAEVVPRSAAAGCERERGPHSGGISGAR